MLVSQLSRSGSEQCDVSSLQDQMPSMGVWIPWMLKLVVMHGKLTVFLELVGGAMQVTQELTVAMKVMAEVPLAVV